MLEVMPPGSKGGQVGLRARIDCMIKRSRRAWGLGALYGYKDKTGGDRMNSGGEPRLKGARGSTAAHV